MYQSGNFNSHLNVTGKIIKEYRNKNNFSLTDLSTKLALIGIDIPKSSLHKVETGIRVVRDYELCAFAIVLKIPFEKLFEDFINEIKE